MKNRIQSKGQGRITAAEYQRRFCKLNPKPPKTDRFRSSWEREFALWLTAAHYDWKYESIRLRLADRTTYTPDFYVPIFGGFLEVKGFRRQAGMIKFKVAKEQYPEFKFYLVTKNKIGGWVIS